MANAGANTNGSQVCVAAGRIRRQSGRQAVVCSLFRDSPPPPSWHGTLSVFVLHDVLM